MGAFLLDTLKFSVYILPMTEEEEYEIAKQNYLKSLQETANAYKVGNSQEQAINYLLRAAETLELAKTIKKEDLVSITKFL